MIEDEHNSKGEDKYRVGVKTNARARRRVTARWRTSVRARGRMKARARRRVTLRSRTSPRAREIARSRDRTSMSMKNTIFFSQITLGQTCFVSFLS